MDVSTHCELVTLHQNHYYLTTPTTALSIKRGERELTSGMVISTRLGKASNSFSASNTIWENREGEERGTKDRDINEGQERGEREERGTRTGEKRERRGNKGQGGGGEEIRGKER